MGQHRKEKQQKQKDSQSSIVSDPYDVSTNRQKLARFRTSKGREVTCDNLSSHPSEYILSNDQTPYPSVTSPNPSPWEFYTQLDNKFSEYSSKNESAHTDLRKELEEKIDKMLSKEWYIWTVIGIVAIVGVWYLLSYSPLLEGQNKSKEKIDYIEDKMNNIAPTRDQIEVSDSNAKISNIHKK